MLRADLHVHSRHSDGEGDYADILTRAKEQGLDLVAVTDHWDPYLKNDSVQPDLTALSVSGLHLPRTDFPRLLLGVETGPIVSSALRGIPLVIASVHYLPSGYRGEKGNLYDKKYWAEYQNAVLKLARCGRAQILGHIAGYLPLSPLLATETTFLERREIEAQIRTRFFTNDWYEKLFLSAAASGTAIELHTATQTPGPEMARLAIDLGAKLSIGSDAHSLERVGDIHWALDLMDQIGAACENLYHPMP